MSFACFVTAVALGAGLLLDLSPQVQPASNMMRNARVFTSSPLFRGLPTHHPRFRARGDGQEAMRWLRRAAESAGEAGDDERALSLSRVVADLHDELEQAPIPASAPYPAPPSSRSAQATARAAPSLPERRCGASATSAASVVFARLSSMAVWNSTRARSVRSWGAAA